MLCVQINVLLFIRCFTCNFKNMLWGNLPLKWRLCFLWLTETNTLGERVGLETVKFYGFDWSKGDLLLCLLQVPESSTTPLVHYFAKFGVSNIYSSVRPHVIYSLIYISSFHKLSRIFQHTKCLILNHHIPDKMKTDHTQFSSQITCVLYMRHF